MYTLAIVGVYACLASGGEWPGPACLHIPLPAKHREAARDLTLSFIQGSSSSSCNPWSAPWEGLHQKGAAASQQLLAHS